jgi:heme-degrading monooxygenase HmoA
MIKVIIERNIAEGLELNYVDAIRTTLKAVLEAPGYISSQSLTDIHRPNHRLIVTNWTSVEAWEKWQSSQERKKALADITPILHDGEKITVAEIR